MPSNAPRSAGAFASTGIDTLLKAKGIKEIVCTDTIPIPENKMLPNITVLTVSELLAEVIIRSHEGRSVGELFNE